MLLAQISTPMCTDFVNNQEREYEQYQATHARDIFLKNIRTESFLESVPFDSRPNFLRELQQIAYLLKIDSLQMRLDEEDWDQISRVMWSVVVSSLESKVTNESGRS